MLAVARIGAVHSIVFGGFSPEALGQRITDCESDFLVTADEGLGARRGSRSRTMLTKRLTYPVGQ